MSVILVVDDMAVFREPIAASLRAHRFEVLTAADGQQALAAITGQRPDLILLDVAMPVMDGLAVLRALRGNPQYRNIPVILLTAVAERDYVKQAAQLGIQDYLLKSHFSLEDLVGRIRRRLEPPAAGDGAEAEAGPRMSSAGASAAEGGGVALAAPPQTIAARPAAGVGLMIAGPTDPREIDDLIAGLKPIITKEDLHHLVEEGLALRPLAPVVQNVMAVTANPRCSSDDVAKAVGQDQALSIRILKLANGSVYSRGIPVDNLRQAVGRLGSREVRNLVMTLSVLEQFEGRISQYMDARLFWEHAAGCGLIASAVARQAGLRNLDDFFLWGLLHDVGRLILLEHLPDKYAQVWEAAHKLGLPMERVESRLLAVDHCSVMDKARAHWRFPEEFTIPVANHHQPVSALKRLPEAFVFSATAVAFADRLANALLLGSSGNNVLHPYDDFAELLELRGEVITELAATIPFDTDSVKVSLLARGGDTPWPGVIPELRQRLQHPVRPLFVGPQGNAVELFFSRVCGTVEAEPPNLSIVYLPDTRQQISRFADLESRERGVGGERLPLLVVVDKGKLDVNLGALSQRRHAIAKLPVRFDELLELAGRLVVSS